MKSRTMVHAFRVERVTLNMPESMITYRGVVYPWHCDHMGHMNVMWYVGKFDEATWQLLASIGATPLRLREEGFGLVAVEQHIQYKRELRSGDLLTVRSSVLEGKEKSLRFAHEMSNDQTGEVAANMIVVGVCIDSVARKARALPPDILERIASLV
ncbi:MAG TPA: thioesterase family protein [Terriglobales bacterium]|nr:thioesterase family protein [Terriglobales bacterium]